MGEVRPGLYSIQGEHDVKSNHQAGRTSVLRRSHFNLHSRTGHRGWRADRCGSDGQGGRFQVASGTTAAVWSDCVAWSDADSEAQVYQDQSGRLWDVLFMSAYAIRTNRDGGGRLNFALSGAA